MIEVCNPVLKTTNIFEFQRHHLECYCIIDISDEISTKETGILAYAKNKRGNVDLENYYYLQKGYKKPIIILQGISPMEVGCID